MLLPDHTYEGAAVAPAPAHAPPQALHVLLRAHRVRADFFCANRPKRYRHSRKVSAGAGADAETGAEAPSDSRRRRGRARSQRQADDYDKNDASSSNEAVHLQRRLLSLSSELVTLRNHLHVGAAATAATATTATTGKPQPAVPPRAPHALPPPAPQPQPQPPLHPLPAPPEPRWRGTAASSSSACAGADVDDLIHLRGPLTEDAVVRALQARFYQNKFYTMIGPILVAVNPYTDTCNSLTLTAARAQRPELARLVHDAVRHQADTGYPQAIILSGVSGSGKTYASMVLLRRLFDVAGGGPETDAFKHLAAAFTVLRSLGTAATAANSHSSRIGHFIEVQVTDGALYRTKIHCYFLDQTRVVRPPAGERNYHVFYQMLAGLSGEERAQLHLDGYGAQELRYLAAPQPRRAEPDDAARFHAWKTCLGVLGIPFLDVVRVLAAVLLLGNVAFADGAAGAEPAGEAELAAAAALLGVSAAALLRGLTARCPRRARAPAPGAAPAPAAAPVAAPATAAAAAHARDALAKALYCRTVATIVRRANSLKRLGSTLGTLSSDSNESVREPDAASRRTSSAGGGGGRGVAGARSMAALNDAVRHATDGFVGILDMFGFEDAAPSRLEHLCANLCAETMQHFYNTHVFKSSAESCREEGVSAAELAYVDNVPCIDLVSSLRGGLLAALDAECAARGSPDQYVARIRAAHRGHPRLGEARGAQARRFTVRHYAGEVTYDAAEFLEANRDAVPDELLAAFDTRACEFGFATHLFGAELKTLSAAGGPAGAQFRAWPTAAGGAGGAGGASTLTQDFHTRLDNLLRTLVHARPHFVRCLRANHTETPMLFERTTVAKQVRALQVLETVQLMADGYPHRMRFRLFSSRYRALFGRGAGAHAARTKTSGRRVHPGGVAPAPRPRAPARPRRRARPRAAPPGAHRGHAAAGAARQVRPRTRQKNLLTLWPRPGGAAAAAAAARVHGGGRREAGLPAAARAGRRLGRAARRRHRAGAGRRAPRTHRRAGVRSARVCAARGAGAAAAPRRTPPATPRAPRTRRARASLTAASHQHFESSPLKKQKPCANKVH